MPNIESEGNNNAKTWQETHRDFVVSEFGRMLTSLSVERVEISLDDAEIIFDAIKNPDQIAHENERAELHQDIFVLIEHIADRQRTVAGYVVDDDILEIAQKYNDKFKKIKNGEAEE